MKSLKNRFLNTLNRLSTWLIVLDQTERHKRFLILFSFLGIIYFAIYSLLYYFDGKLGVSIFLLILSLIEIFNLLFLKFTKRIEISSGFAIGSFLLLLIALLFFGGFNNNGIIWFSLFPPLAFFLGGTKKGIAWNIILALSIVLVGLLSYYDFFVIKFSLTTLRQVFFSTSAVCFVIILYQIVNDKFHNTLEKKSNDLENALTIIKKEFQTSSESEKILAEQNLLLEDTKKATINILEDLEIERSNLTKERDKINAILKSIGDAVFVVDINLKILLINEAAKELCGCVGDDTIGRNYEEVLNFVYENNNAKNDEFVKKAISSGQITHMDNNTILINKNGNKIPVADSASPLKNSKGEVIGCVVVFRDVTKEREVDKAKTEFVSLASHQLRTPLSAINWYLELLRDSAKSVLTPEHLGFIKEIEQGNQRMIDLVNSLLNVSRIDLGTFAIEPSEVNVVEIAESVLTELQPQIISKKHNIVREFEPDLPMFNYDKNLTRIIFQNLISNAVKYTPDNGEIRIKVFRNSEYLQIEVHDNGFGIPKDQQVKIYNKLFRADNVVKKDVDGNGLGLYIVKSIVDNVGGKIWFQSEENKGTIFYVNIPLNGMVAKQGSRALGQ